MTKTKKHTKLAKMLAVFLIMAVSITCLSITAFAEAFYRGGDVWAGSYNAFETSFSTNSNNRFTLSARAVTKYGTPTQMHLSVQVYGSYGWTEILNDDIGIDLDTQTICQDVVIPSNTSMRIVCTVSGGTGICVATVHMGIGMWQHS